MANRGGRPRLQTEGADYSSVKEPEEMTTGSNDYRRVSWLTQASSRRNSGDSASTDESLIVEPSTRKGGNPFSFLGTGFKEERSGSDV